MSLYICQKVYSNVLIVGLFYVCGIFLNLFYVVNEEHIKEEVHGKSSFKSLLDVV